MSSDLPIVVAQWARNSRDTVMIRIDLFNGHAVIDLRTWWKANNGELRPGRSGITMSVRHLPALARALSEAEVIASKLGLLGEADTA